MQTTFLSTADHVLASSSNGKRKLAASASHMSHPQMSHRAVHEYQFLPEQLSVRSETYDRVSQSHYYDSSLDASSARATSLPKKLHGNEQGVPNYTFQGQMSSGNLLSQSGRQQNFPSISMDSDGPPHSDMFPISASDTQFGMHQVGLENQSISSDRRSARDDDLSRLERKRKVSTISLFMLSFLKIIFTAML